MKKASMETLRCDLDEGLGLHESWLRKVLEGSREFTRPLWVKSTRQRSFWGLDREPHKAFEEKRGNRKLQKGNDRARRGHDLQTEDSGGPGKELNDKLCGLLDEVHEELLHQDDLKIPNLFGVACAWDNSPQCRSIMVSCAQQRTEGTPGTLSLEFKSLPNPSTRPTTFPSVEPFLHHDFSCLACQKQYQRAHILGCGVSFSDLHQMIFFSPRFVLLNETLSHKELLIFFSALASCCPFHSMNID